jgi:hypothetical protein
MYRYLTEPIFNYIYRSLPICKYWPICTGIEKKKFDRFVPLSSSRQIRPIFNLLSEIGLDEDAAVAVVESCPPILGIYIFFFKKKKTLTVAVVESCPPILGICIYIYMSQIGYIYIYIYVPYWVYISIYMYLSCPPILGICVCVCVCVCLCVCVSVSVCVCVCVCV